MFFRAWLLSATVLLLSGLLPGQETGNSADVAVRRLGEIVPDHPTIVNRKAMTAMQDAAATKRLDAALLLIKALAFNYDPDNINETKSDSEMIPAIPIMKQWFGSQIGELLYAEGISARQKWYRNRIALAIRTILPKAQIEEINRKYSSQSAQTDEARQFFSALNSAHLELEFASSTQGGSANLGNK